MSKPPASLLRTIASSSRHLAGNRKASIPRNLHQSSRLAQAAPATEISFIDSRILEGQAFLPKENVARITEWQAGLWKKLQSEVNNNPGLSETKKNWDNGKIDLPALLHKTAVQPELSLAFNYASLLLNNSFFLERLSVGTRQAVPAGLEHLEDRVVAYADGIVGSAWLWVVRVAGSSPDTSQIDVIPTFGAGSFIVAGRNQRGRDTLPAVGQPSSSSSNPVAPSRPFNEATRAGQRSRQGHSSSSGASTYPIPLAVLSLYEHAYLGPSYGVWGRKEYARDWYRSLDWNRIIST